MKKPVFFGLVLILTLVFRPESGLSQQNPGDVWVPPHTLPSGQVIPGYWRPPFRKGFYWVKGREDENGNWIPGHWNPVHSSSSDQAWVPGYWNGTIWIEGYWRPHCRPGHRWVRPCWRDNRWYRGHWEAYEGGQPWRTRYPRD